MLDHLSKTDLEIANAIKNEIARQQNGLEMIASENIASKAVLEALGTPLTDKYSEGYPGKRYYGGNAFIDIIENTAIERAKKLFGAEHANVQPHAGASANMAAYFALMNPGDTFLAMDLRHGGHLTHGAPVSFSGKFYRAAHYGVRREDELIDMDEVRSLAMKEKPKVIVAGWSAYPRHLDFKAFREIAEEAGAYLMTDMAHFAGLAAAKVYPDPVPHSDVVTTTTHKTLRGPRGALILCKKHDRLRPSEGKTLADRIDSAVFPGIQGGPLEHCIAAKAAALGEALQPSFIEYQKQVIANARALAEGLLSEGFRLVSGGTDTHLVLCDLSLVGIGGAAAESLLESIGIYANRNLIPFDARKAADPSGLRLGTPALTTRGFKESEMKEIASIIGSILKNPTDTGIKDGAAKKVKEMASAHPVW